MTHFYAWQFLLNILIHQKKIACGKEGLFVSFLFLVVRVGGGGKKIKLEGMMDQQVKSQVHVLEHARLNVTME